MAAAIAMIEKQKELTGLNAERVAGVFDKGVHRILAELDHHAASAKVTPPKLPDALKQPKLQEFLRSRKRGLTGQQVADTEEKNRTRAQRKAQRDKD